MELEPYISIENGLFNLGSNSAINDGQNEELVKMQEEYLLKYGKLKTESNL
ncbi:hypothetical protein ACN6MY_17945 [Peribacillus sp. B-H-3]|uniref:hypothetical protein n=1 Tax=Peribacillus sp. B-H-3 TaxID=3400420 RepID=UPI003B011F5C